MKSTDHTDIQFKESMNVQALEMARKDNIALGKGLAEAGEEFAKYRAAKVRVRPYSANYTAIRTGSHPT